MTIEFIEIEEAERCVECGEWTESGFLSDDGVCDDCEEQKESY